MEAAIRAALEKAGIPGAQARRRIYDSARGALDRSLERQGISDPERVADHRQRLEVLIASIESEWTPPSGDAVQPPATPAPAQEPAAPVVEPPAAASAAPSVEPPAPVQAATARPAPVAPAEPSFDTPAPAAAAAPSVAPVSRPAAAQGQTPRSSPEADLDIAPDVRDHAAATGQPETVAAPKAERAAPAPKPARKVKVPKPKKEKRRRGIFAGLFSAAVMLSFFGIGIWWLIESGALKSAAERDTGVPNPPPSLSRDDFAGGPQQLNPGAAFSGEWANVFTPGRDGDPESGSNATAAVLDVEDGTVLRIVSGAGNESGEVRVPLGREVLQALAGRQSVLALTVRSASTETTQIYVKCEFSVLGDCGRRRFNVTYETSDVLFNLDYDRALAPNEGGSLVINSDISGGGKGIDLIAVRIRPVN